MKILVIGSGSIGRRHSMNAENMARWQCSTRINRCRKMLRRMAACRSHLLSRQSSGDQGCVIVTPGHSHLAIARELAQHVRRLLIEKPLCIEMMQLRLQDA